MTGFLLVDTGIDRQLAADAAILAGAGHRVVLYLVQDGVTRALRGQEPAGDATVWVDGPSLAHRALRPGDLRPGVTVVDMPEVADLLLADGVRVVWH
ncbi:DsrE family protein [Longispora sp. NPDC051575]|uniref:DsrE family protein n=1 Tax=Longispora sp. NPDC051575 TaxID=3154943 RepID=UPI0034346ECF